MLRFWTFCKCKLLVDWKPAEAILPVFSFCQLFLHPAHGLSQDCFSRLRRDRNDLSHELVRQRTRRTISERICQCSLPAIPGRTVMARSPDYNPDDEAIFMICHPERSRRIIRRTFQKLTGSTPQMSTKHSICQQIATKCSYTILIKTNSKFTQYTEKQMQSIFFLRNFRGIKG